MRIERLAVRLTLRKGLFRPAAGFLLPHIAHRCTHGRISGPAAFCFLVVASQWGTVGLSMAQATEDPARIGIRVQPPVMSVRGVPPGREVPFPAPITVENSGAQTISCKVEPIAASSMGMRMMRGYVDIPDPAWCRPELGAVTLAPGEAISISLKLLVPEDHCHYNRHWCLAFSIQTSGGGTLGAAAYPYVYVETVSHADTIRPPQATGDARAQSPVSPRGTETETPAGHPTAGEPTAGHGCVIISPGALEAGDVPLGTKSDAGSISIRNSYDYDISLDVGTFVPEPGRSARNALITPGHMWIENANWLRPALESLLVHAGEEAVLPVTIAGPSDSAMINYRWEGLLAISSSDGSQSLVRVRWRTTRNSFSTDPLSPRPHVGDKP